jgi:hypothetical protein
MDMVSDSMNLETTYRRLEIPTIVQDYGYYSLIDYYSLSSMAGNRDGPSHQRSKTIFGPSTPLPSNIIVVVVYLFHGRDSGFVQGYFQKAHFLQLSIAVSLISQFRNLLSFRLYHLWNQKEEKRQSANQFEHNCCWVVYSTNAHARTHTPPPPL